MSELKRCPFCGSEKLANYMTSNGATNIYCVDCFEANDGISINIVAWNTRPIEDELQAERDDWRKGAERFIQLANYNNKRAGEYFELHEQLVEKYKETK